MYFQTITEFHIYIFTPSTAQDHLQHQLAAPGVLRRSILGAIELKHYLVLIDALKQLVELNCRSGRAFRLLHDSGREEAVLLYLSTTLWLEELSLILIGAFDMYW